MGVFVQKVYMLGICIAQFSWNMLNLESIYYCKIKHNNQGLGAQNLSEDERRLVLTAVSIVMAHIVP